MNLHGISFGTPQAIFHLGRLKFKSVPPPWGLKMAFYAPLNIGSDMAVCMYKIQAKFIVQ